MDTPLLYTIPQSELSLDALDHITFSYLQLGRLGQAQELAEALCKRAPESENGWTRLAPKVLRYVKRRMLGCVEHTEWEHVFQKGEVEQLPENLASILLVPWTQDLRRQLRDIYGDERSPSLTLDSHISLTTILPNTAEPSELPLMLYKYPRPARAPQRRTTSSSLPHLPSSHLALPLRARLSSRRRSTEPTSVSHSTPQDGY